MPNNVSITAGKKTAYVEKHGHVATALVQFDGNR
jgi:hypothetical protein